MPTASSPHPPFRTFQPIATPYGDLIVRPISVDDAALAQDFVTGLSPASRYFRFFQVMSQLSPALLERFLASDRHDHLTLIAVSHIGDRPRMIGEARYIAACGGMAAEFAVAIADDWQRLGIARALIERLEASAANSGIRHLKGETLPTNAALIACARALGFRIWCDAEDRHVLCLAKNLGL